MFCNQLKKGSNARKGCGSKWDGVFCLTVETSQGPVTIYLIPTPPNSYAGTSLVTQSPTKSSDLMMTVLCRGGIAGAIALGGGAYYFMSGGKTKETLLHQNVVCRV